MPTQRILLVGSLTNRNARPVTGSDQQFINCFPEINKNPITGKASAFLNKRFGFGTTSALVSGGVGSYGSVLWAGNSNASSPSAVSFYKSSGPVTSVWDAVATTQIGSDISTTNACLNLTETVISGVANLVGYFVDSGTFLIEAWFFAEGGSWTQITDGDFPPNIGTPEPLATASGPAHMDGYMFVMTKNGKVWNSDLNSLSSWTASTYITAQSNPDGGMGVARYKNLIVAFGTKSTEFFQNTGNASGSPLSVIGNASLSVGCAQFGATYRSILNVGETVYWIGIVAQSGEIGIYRLNGYQAEKVSNPFIDKILNDSSNPVILGFAGAMTMHGQTHIYMFSGGNLNDSYVFCPQTNEWWISETVSNQQPLSIVGNNFKSSAGSLIACYINNQNSVVFKTSQAVFTDGGSAFTQTVRTDNLDFGTTNRKFFERIRPVCDVQSATSVLTVEQSFDDFATWRTLGTIDLSSLDAINTGLVRCGSGRRMALRLTHSANTPNRMSALDITYTVGSS